MCCVFRPAAVCAAARHPKYGAERLVKGPRVLPASAMCEQNTSVLRTLSSEECRKQVGGHDMSHVPSQGVVIERPRLPPHYSPLTARRSC